MKADGQLSFRRFTAGDRKAISTILSDTFRDYAIELPEDYSFTDIENVQATYLDTQGAFTVLIKNDRMIGFFGLLPASDGHILLQRLYLDAGQRGKGFGDHLIEQAMQQARQMGFTCMHLETTSAFKEAVGLYKKHGFVADEHAQPSAGHDVALVKVL